MKNRKWWLLALIAVVVIGFFLLDGPAYLSFERLRAERDSLAALVAANPGRSLLLYGIIYVLVTALSLPGAAVMTLAGGALFGFWWGMLVVSFASTFGATLAFLASRLLFQRSIRTRFGPQLAAVDRGIRQDGAYYLFTLRMVPLFPFFLINLLMGLTAIRLWTYYWVSQLGMLAGTAVYVNAGTQLGRIEDPAQILSLPLLLSFALLGVFPLLARQFMAWLRRRRVYRGWRRPDQFDANVLVIGAGAAGLVSAYIAAAVKARVVLVEKAQMGGDCLNTGCVPSKALIRAARAAHDARHAAAFGVHAQDVRVDFAAVMAHVRDAIQRIEPHDSVDRYEGLGVHCVQGAARLTSPWTVTVNDRTLRARSIVLATGAQPRVPEIPGLAQVPWYTSDTIWNLEQLPGRLLVIGGGPIGCELAHAFARLGSGVTMVQHGDRFLPREDEDCAAYVCAQMQADGVRMLTAHEPQEFVRMGGASALLATHLDVSVQLEFDVVLFAAGREARTAGFGLQELGIRLTGQGTIEVNEYLETTFPNIYACGDAAGPYQFTHYASHQAWYAVVNALFGRFRRFRVDNSVVPWCTYTDPELARVGLNEQDAQRQGVAYECTRYDLGDLDRAITEGAARGLVKVLTVPGSDRILGATIVGPQAGELISEFVTAMRHRLGLNKVLGTIHVYPTLTEANKMAAGAWKRAHAPALLLKWLERWHLRGLGGSGTVAALQNLERGKPDA